MREYYIGGEPGMDNNRTNWQIKVDENPMPIYYSLKPISQLFHLLNATKDFNDTKAAYDF